MSFYTNLLVYKYNVQHMLVVSFRYTRVGSFVHIIKIFPILNGLEYILAAIEQVMLNCC